MDPVQERNSSGIQVISRAASVLNAVEQTPEGLSLGEISREIDLPRSTVQRIVAALTDVGFLIAASPTAKVKLGPAILRLAASTETDVTKTLRPFLINLSREVQETVDLSTQRGGSVLFVDQIQGKRRLVAVSAIGERFPLHCTANGKAILSLLSPKDADDAVTRSAREHADHPLQDRDKLLAEIEQVRQTGLAYDREEMTPGISAIGTALTDPFGRVIAMTIPAPAERFRRNHASYAEKLLACRAEIVKKLL
ncbi:MAG: IclR family transcriptional regulator [Azospirillaceae bacterium]|nr:IclR family transcriptional regulator [Azospirillaceae bacterium]